MLEVTAGLPDEDFLAREIIKCRDLGRSRSGYDDFVDTNQKWPTEIEFTGSCFRRRQIRRDKIRVALEQRRQQLITTDRYDDDVDLDVAAIELLVNVGLESLHEFVDSAFRLAVVIIELIPAIRHQHADHAPLDHAFVVALPGRPDRREGHRQKLARGWVDWRLFRGLGFLDYGRLGYPLDNGLCCLLLRLVRLAT